MTIKADMYKRLRDSMDEETEALIREALKKETISLHDEFGELKLISSNGRKVYIYQDTIAYVDDLNSGIEEDYDLVWCGIIDPSKE